MPHEPSPEKIPFVNLGLDSHMAQEIAYFAIGQCLELTSKAILPQSRLAHIAFGAQRIDYHSMDAFHHGIIEDARVREVGRKQSDPNFRVIGRPDQPIDMSEIRSVCDGIVTYFIEHVPPDTRVGQGGIIKIARSLGYFLYRAEINTLFQVLGRESAITLLDDGGYMLATKK